MSSLDSVAYLQRIGLEMFHSIYMYIMYLSGPVLL